MNRFILPFLTAMVLPQASFAQTAQCGPRQAVLDFLDQKHGEARRAIGVGQNNHVVEVFAGDNGTWTIIVTSADGKTCLVASGTDFESFGAAPSGDPA